MHDANPSHFDLQAIAKQVMERRGFEPDFPAAVADQLATLRRNPPQIAPGSELRDLRDLLWSSIDNDTSRDLDQIEVAEPASNGAVKIMIGIADVDAFAPKQTPIDQHAAKETTTVYTGIRNFSMLPEELSTGITSLLQDQDRLAIVTEFVVDSAGSIQSSDCYRAIVRNKAQLQYNSLGAWLENASDAPAKVKDSRDLQQQLKLQDEVAHRLKEQRHQHGALNLETDEVHPLVLNEQVVDMVKQERNRATDLIEDFMVAANGVVARHLENVSSLRRVVRTPERWDRIVQLAATKGEELPADPDAKALNDFLIRQKASDPDRFAELSLIVIKLIGPGEYVLKKAGEVAPGHFGLAVQDYTHSTAPNRRFADLVTQRLIKAMISGQKNSPYSDDELTAIAANCTEKGDAARKVERDMSKRLAAVAMQHRMGELFDAMVTGVTDHGTFVRVLQPHVEGLLVQGHGFDVGDKLRVKLINADVEKGYIDFARV
jgi:VacB/RNase II family 3'-5' exoribonuclease